MDKINVMISSTVKDLLGEREAIANVFERMEFLNLLGTTPYLDSSAPFSSAYKTIEMAKECDLYILILGEEFGFELKDGRSATEAEFDSAYHDDPTKILVFLKEGNSTSDHRQEKFIKRVCDYYSGYWRASFHYTHELQTMVMSSLLSWLKDRASLGDGFTYIDHFIRLAIKRKPTPEAAVYYSVKEDYVDIEYRFFGNVQSVQFSRQEIYKDFWGCLYSLERQFTI